MMMMHHAAAGVCFGFLELFGLAMSRLGEFYLKLFFFLTSGFSTVQESRGKM